MTDWNRFVQDEIDRGSAQASRSQRTLVGRYADAEAEYRALANGPALVDRSYRSLLEVTGADRAGWLHNLTSNEVKNLSPGEGNYTFALNIKGRILFDLVILVREEALWIDLDSIFVETACTHFEKYKIVEDVVIANRTAAYTRFGLVGESARKRLADMGASNAASMSRFASTQLGLDDTTVPIFRSDFCGPFAVELFIPTDRAVELWQSLCAPTGAHQWIPVGDDAVQRHRIEAGLPWPGREITEEYLPAETGQYERGVSRAKGCYLGQEIVERMRSRGVVARRLVGLRLEKDQFPELPAPLASEPGTIVGELTSAYGASAGDAAIGLGYVKSGSAAPGTLLTASIGEQTVSATVVDLPFAANVGDQA